MPIQVGQTICHGKYEILALAGEGSFARVWQARQPGFDNLIVAVKELKREELTPQQLREREQRFQREIRLGRALLEAKARGVVLALTLDHLPESGVPLLVLEYMSGGSLADRIRQHPAGMPVLQSLNITLALCGALSAFHSLSVLPVHRDIKPSNILFSASGDAHLADFGLAQLPGESARSFGAGQRHPGTPLYMPPEQAGTVGSLAPAADIFALGCLLFEMLSGKPYGRYLETPVGVLRPELAGSDLEQVLAKALAEKWQERYQRAGELAVVLRSLRDELVAGEERTARVGALRRQAGDALAAGRFVVAEQAVNAWLALAPEDEEARALRTRIAAEERAAILADRIATQRQNFENALAGEDWPAAHATLENWGRFAPDDAELRTARRRLAQAEASARRRDQINALLERAEAALAAGNWCRARRAAEDWRRLEPDSEAMRAVLKAAEQLRAGHAGSVCLPLLDRPVPTRLVFGLPVALFVTFSLAGALYWFFFIYIPERNESVAATATAVAEITTTAEAAALSTSIAATETALAMTVATGEIEPSETRPPDVPTPTYALTPWTPTPAGMPTSTPVIYTVQEADVLLSIADRFGVDLDELMAVNNISNPNAVFVGLELIIPEPRVSAEASYDVPVVTYAIQRGDTFLSISDQFGIPLDQLAAFNGIDDLAAPLVGQELLIPLGGHVVTEGESLAGIADQYDVSVDDLIALNIDRYPSLPDELIRGSLLRLPQDPPADPSIGDTRIRPTDGMTMVYVPAGSFLMGSEEGDPDAFDDEFPQHEVALDGFWIDQTEVTNGHYERCVDEGECLASRYADDSTLNGSDQPVVGVSWDDATDYCAWAGGRLPTEAEWEYAARGPDAYRYPWGDTFDGELVNFCDSNCEFSYANNDYDDGYARTAPVGSYPAGASWVDALDMAGNVWEWVQDWYESGYYENSPVNNPAGPASGDYKVLRGGGWSSNSRIVRSANRYNVPASSVAATSGSAAPSPRRWTPDLLVSDLLWGVGACPHRNF